MDIHEVIAKLTRNPLFTEWHGKNKDYFLAHVFVLLDEPNKDTCQVGFYNTGKQRIVTFMVTGDKIQQTDEQEVLKSEGEIVALDLDGVKLTVEEALKKAHDCYEEHYKHEPVIKQFFILQHTEGSTMFNITYFTQSFKTINVKIDAKDGNIIKHSLQSLVEFA